MTEPTVPDPVVVPRAWLERLMPTLRLHTDAAMIQTAEWALSQPTPPAKEFEPGTRVRLTAEGAEGYSKANWAKDNTGIVTRKQPLGDGPVRSQPRVMVQWYGYEWEVGTLTSRLERVEQVADMGPRTTFTETTEWTVQGVAFDKTWAVDGKGTVRDLSTFDPSTIRDVQIPEEG